MLNELDSLSENINRLIHLVEGSRHTLAERDAQLARAKVERDEALTSNSTLRAERDKLRDERDALLSKIEDAQVKLNAILAKLPPPRVSPDAQPDTDEALAHEDGVEHHQHAHGETYER